MDGFTASLPMYNSDVRKQTQHEALAFVMPPFKQRDCLAAREQSLHFIVCARLGWFRRPRFGRRLERRCSS